MIPTSHGRCVAQNAADQTSTAFYTASTAIATASPKTPTQWHDCCRSSADQGHAPANPILIVVRHAPVDEQYRGVCYGRSDVVLGPEGEQQSRHVVEELTIWKGATVIHSGLQRSRFLAERLAERLECSAVCCPALQERDFGTWELQSWNDIHAQYGDDMLRMISEPDTYRPGGGETTFEMRDRVMRWFDSVPDDRLTIAVTHGGPIAALLGTQRQRPVSEWVDLIPRCGQFLSIHTRATEQG